MESKDGVSYKETTGYSAGGGGVGAAGESKGRTRRGDGSQGVRGARGGGRGECN